MDMLERMFNMNNNIGQSSFYKSPMIQGNHPTQAATDAVDSCADRIICMLEEKLCAATSAMKKDVADSNNVITALGNRRRTGLAG